MSIIFGLWKMDTLKNFLYVALLVDLKFKLASEKKNPSTSVANINGFF